MVRRTLLCWIALVAVALPLFAWAKVPALERRVTCDKLQLPLPKNITQEAAPPVEIFTYKWMRGKESGTEERYDPRQLWEAEQRLGMWSDAQGNLYELVKPLSRLDSFRRGIETEYRQDMYHVLKEEYKQNRKAVGKVKRKELPAWLEDWTGELFYKPQTLRAMAAVEWELFVPARERVALLFCLRKEPNQAYALIIKTAEDEPSAWKSALTRAMGRIAFTSKLRPKQTQQEGWNTLSGKHYQVLSNLPKSYERFQRTLLNDMEAMRTVYAQYLPAPKKMKVPTSVIRLFATPEEYHAYAGSGDEWSSGVFSTTHRELVVMGNVEAGSKDEQKEDMQRVTFHEGTHQYLFSISPPATLIPIWFNEGHATFFETFTLKTTTGPGARRKVTGVPHLSPRLLVVQQDSRFCTAAGLAQLMSLSHQAFYEEQHRNAAYASAWVLVHWLRTEAPEALAQTLNQYYALICKGKSPQEALSQVYPRAVLEQIAEGLMTFLEENEYTP
jgi:hypothetical protein